MKAAAQELRAVLPDVRFSRVYRSTARDFEAQDDFLNAIAMSEKERTPDEMLRELTRIEESLGKNVPFRFGPEQSTSICC